MTDTPERGMVGPFALRWSPVSSMSGYALALPPGEPSQANFVYARGMVPFHGFAARHERADRIAHVELLSVLTVRRHDSHWLVSDDQGVLGAARWRAGDEGKEHAQHPGITILYPTNGWVVVLARTQFRDGTRDIRGIAGEGAPPTILPPVAPYVYPD